MVPKLPKGRMDVESKILKDQECMFSFIHKCFLLITISETLWCDEFLFKRLGRVLSISYLGQRTVSCPQKAYMRRMHISRKISFPDSQCWNDSNNRLSVFYTCKIAVTSHLYICRSQKA